MATIAYLTEEQVNKNPYLQEALRQGIINYGALADLLMPDLKIILKKKIKHSAVMMALRRYSDKLDKKIAIPKTLLKGTSLTMTSHLCRINVSVSKNIRHLIEEFYKIVDFSVGGILNITKGNYEIGIVTNIEYKDSLLNILKDENVLKIENNLVALSIKYSLKSSETPGVIFAFTRAFAWENINICEVISTLTETTYVIEGKDATRAFSALQKVINSWL